MRGFSRFAWWLGPACFALFGAFAACEDTQRANGPVAPNVEAGTDAGIDAVILIANDANRTGDSPAVSDGDAPDVPRPDAGSQPVVECGARSTDAQSDAEDGSGECAIPPSRCVDQRWLIYYDTGACIDGHCRWQEKLYLCPLACDVNGCISNRTAPASL